MPLGVWLFATKAHVDIKRMLSKMALAVHDTTARDALNSISRQSLLNLRANVGRALADTKPSPYCRKVLDNIQQHQPVHEHRLGAVSQLITGTAATAVILDDFSPGAFDLGRLQDEIFKNERRHLTVNALLRDLSTAHLEEVTALHFLRVLCKHSPVFAVYSTSVSDRFRTAPISKHRMREGRKTEVVPLGSNGHYEMATDGMRDAQLDFDEQSGHTKDAVEKANVVLLYGGDGGSVMSSGRVAQELRHLACTQGPFSTRECVLMTPGIWHVRYTMVNTLAANFFGPSASKDPSSISRAAWATNLHRPTNLSKCDFFATVRTLQVVYEARIMDIWSRELAGDTDLDEYYTIGTHQLPTFSKLLSIARQISSKYASSRGLRRVESAKAAADAPPDLSFPVGDSRHARVVDTPTASNGRDAAESDERDHVEVPGYSGDRVLSNAILFLREWTMWEECTYAVSEGDIGRVWEVFKYWIFVFAGGGNHNYRSIILELYCLFRYKASVELKEAVWNNWLVNVTGELGKWIEDDLMQEHYNRWLEDMISKHGGKFEDPLFRETISPNVEFFINLKKEIEIGLGLYTRSQSHTSSDHSAEHKILRKIYRDDQVHFFVSGRSKGHAAKDLFELGYHVLGNGKLQEFLEYTSADARLLADLRHRPSPAPLPSKPSEPVPLASIANDELELLDPASEAAQRRLAVLDDITERLSSVLTGDIAETEMDNATEGGDAMVPEEEAEVNPDVDTEGWLDENDGC
ncbi:hypothetical protein CYLTODRAFT_412104 [Cylindrobasidium torrendii FP15055 ss-10]|uniref:DUF6589 domain-containing protein n=1 Tax=Cylindrobasidium torrendii FP15055 ss-10 TaxID=1314674 RepID=A0A0D7B6D6_9AGAR|nr:hypothetical protein CYLTODRAFT_412104 [Cylindrobasidium torrendii FP15055 ss-10]